LWSRPNVTSVSLAEINKGFQGLSDIPNLEFPFVLPVVEIDLNLFEEIAHAG
jgi:hypothetical protein